MSISATTRVCAVIGDPVGHSLSPAIHNAAFEACGLDYLYTAFHVRRGDTAGALAGVRALQIRGLSVTIPHKIDIIPHLDEIDDVARNIGSVNTVLNEGGRLTGSSTDGPGALRALRAEGIRADGRRVLLLGSGGAARAIAFSLATLKPAPRLRILGVEEAELRALGEDLRSRTEAEVADQMLTAEALSEAMSWSEIVVHSTPVGMTPNEDASLVPADLVRADHTVFDAVYTPFETKLLREATEAGAVTVPGIGMFVQQAAIQFELWTGREAPIDVMEHAVKTALGQEQ